MTHASSRHGWCLVDLLVSLLSIGAALAVVVPVLGQLGGASQIDVSAGNLSVLGQASAMYAADWNGRQFTNINDDISSYGDSLFAAGENFALQEGEHPPVLLGWGGSSSGVGLWGYWMDFPGNWPLLQPINFVSGGGGYGMFRMTNVAPFHQYVNGRYFDPTFYAPGDTAPYALAEPLFDEPWEYVAGDTSPTWWSSYCFSPAAMFDPAVMGGNRDGTFQDPWTFDAGFTSPPFSAAAYPDLKTHILEHNWVQSPPATCNPVFYNGTYDDCEPYFFNHGLDSAPVTLFYDGHVRMLPNEEVLVADQMVLQQSGGDNGLWHRGTPFGIDGYTIESGFDGAPLSHHILTTSGILGRDVLNTGYGVKQSVSASWDLQRQAHRPQIVNRPPGSELLITAGP